MRLAQVRSGYGLLVGAWMILCGSPHAAEANGPRVDVWVSEFTRHSVTLRALVWPRDSGGAGVGNAPAAASVGAGDSFGDGLGALDLGSGSEGFLMPAATQQLTGRVHLTLGHSSRRRSGSRRASSLASSWSSSSGVSGAGAMPATNFMSFVIPHVAVGGPPQVYQHILHQGEESQGRVFITSANVIDTSLRWQGGGSALDQDGSVSGPVDRIHPISSTVEAHQAAGFEFESGAGSTVLIRSRQASPGYCWMQFMGVHEDRLVAFTPSRPIGTYEHDVPQIASVSGSAAERPLTRDAAGVFAAPLRRATTRCYVEGAQTERRRPSAATVDGVPARVSAEGSSL